MFGPGISGGVPSTGGMPAVRSFADSPFPAFPKPFSTSGWWLVDSAGSNTYPYDTWAKAANLGATIAAIDVAGDSVYFASTHNETNATTFNWLWAGTATNPTKLLSADKTSGAPPATLAAGATVTSTAGIAGPNGSSAALYCYGLILIGGTTSAGAVSLNSGGLYKLCSFQTSAVSGTSTIAAPNSNILADCTFKFGAITHSINCGTNTRWSGGSLLAGGTSPTTLFSGAGFFENLDLTNADPAINLASAALASITLRNIKMPSAWTGSLDSSTPGTFIVNTLYNCDSAGTNYILHRQTQFGDIYSETTIVRSGGASDGTTPLSWKMVALAASGTFPITALQTGEFVEDNETTGSPKTVTVEFVHDMVANLQNNQIWLEVSYFSDTGSPLGTLVSSAMTDVLQAPTDCPASTASWTTTGLTNPNTQKLSVTFTPQLKGYFLATVKLCKSGHTVFVDPVLTVS